SVRKGVALLIEAWSKAELGDAELTLVGSWGLADGKLRSLPAGIRWVPPCSSQALRDLYRDSHVFVFPSYSDGLDWFCSRVWGVVCPPSLQRQALDPKS